MNLKMSMQATLTTHADLGLSMPAASIRFRAPPRTHETAEIIDHAFKRIQPGIAPALPDQILHEARQGALLAGRMRGARAALRDRAAGRGLLAETW